MPFKPQHGKSRIYIVLKREFPVLFVWFWEGIQSIILGSTLPILGMVISPLLGNPYNGYINRYYWIDNHPLLYGHNGSWSTRSHIMSLCKKDSFLHCDGGVHAKNHYCMMWLLKNGCQNLLTSEETSAPMNILDQEDEVDSDISQHGGTLLKTKRLRFWMEASWFFDPASFELHAPWLRWKCAAEQSRWTGKSTSDQLDISMMQNFCCFFRFFASVCIHHYKTMKLRYFSSHDRRNWPQKKGSNKNEDRS